MAFLKWIVAGLVGALIGAGIWYGIAKWQSETYNWMACLVGLATGVAVRLTLPSGERGIKAGIVAVLITLPFLMFVKHEIALVIAATDPELSEILDQAFEESLDEEAMISTVADKIAMSREEAGLPVEWPEDMTYEDAMWEEDYPVDIWEAAKVEWENLSEVERGNARKEHERAVNETLAFQRREIGGRQTEGTFSPWDIVWFLVASIAAFRLPAGPLSEI